MDDELLKFGMSLNIDMEAFKKEWNDKQKDIQKIINDTTFKVKIGGIQGLTEVQKEVERFARGIRTSSKVDLVNTDSIKGLKDEIRALEIEWSNLSKQQKFSNEATRELTPHALELVNQYRDLRVELERYGLTLKEVEKMGKSFAANRVKFAAEDLTQPDFQLLQMAEHYKILERDSAKAYEAKKREQEIQAKMGESLAEAIILQNQMAQARNADYAALVKQLKAEEELSEKLHYEALRRDAYQNMTQRPFVFDQMAEYYKVAEREAQKAAEAEAELNRLIEEEAAERKRLSDTEAQRGADRFKESQRIQQEKQKELKLIADEYNALKQQLREEARLASMRKNQQDNQRYASRQRQISEGKRIQQILSTEAKTLDAINQRLAIQRQRLSQATIGSAQYRKIERDIEALEARLRSLNGTQQRNVSMTNAQTNAYRSQAGVLNGLKQFMNSYISLLGGFRLLSNIKEITSEFELQRVSLRAITQDAEFADALFARIKTTATESPFATKDLVTYTKQLAAYRIENEHLYDTMTMLADVSAGLGVSMDRLILAYGQVKAASVLRGTELRQFTEAGIPLVDELAKKFSQLRGEVVSTGEVFDLISTRQVPFEMVSDIFKEMTAEGGRFYEMQKKQSETLYGVYENLKDNIQNSFDAIGRSQRGLLMGIGKLATFGAKNFDILSSAVLPLVVGMGAYRLATTMALKGTSGLAVSTNLLSKAEQRLATITATTNTQRKQAAVLMGRAKKANDIYTISIIKASLATNVFTRAWYTLKAAIIANPFGAILTALVSVYSALSAYTNRLGDVDRAQQRASKTAEDYKKSVESDFNLKGYEGLAKKLKEQESLLKSQKKSYKEFANIYPELAEKYKTQEERLEALSHAEENRKNILEQIKSDYPEYFSYLDSENGKVADLARGYADMTEAMRQQRLERLKARADELKFDLSKYQQRSQRTINKWWAGEGWWAIANPVGALAGALGLNLNTAAVRTGSVEAELSGITQEIEALEQASEDAAEAMVQWRKNYKELVMGGNMEDQALAALQFGDAVEDTQKKVSELQEEMARLQRIPSDQMDPSLEERLRKVQEEYEGVIRFLKLYNQEIEKTQTKGKTNSKLQELRSEFQMVQKIYKEYEDLRKLMGDDKAAKEIKKAYSSVTEIDFLSPDLYKKRLEGLAKAVAKTNVTIRKSSDDLTGQQISDIKKWTKEYEEWLKIKEQSGVFAPKPYKVKDKKGRPTGNWTIGWGFELIHDKATGALRRVTEKDTMTLEEANEELQKQLLMRSALLDKLLSSYQGLELTANQYSALLDIVYNTAGGTKNVDKVLKEAEGELNKIPEILEKSFTTAAATGEQLPGLINRAAGRAAMFAADLGDEIRDKFSKISVDNIEQLPSYLAMQIQKAIGDIDIDGITQQLESMLAKISSQIKQQQDASSFFEKILGLTGNVELSTKLTLGVTGVNVKDGDMGSLLSQQLAKALVQEPIAAAIPFDMQIEGTWNEKNIQAAIQSGKITVQQIQETIDNLTAMGKNDLAKTLQSALESYVDYNKQLVEEMYSTINKFADAESKIESLKAQRDVKIDVANRPSGVSDTDWNAYVKAVQRQTDEAIASIQFDELKKKFTEELSNLDIVSGSVLEQIRSKFIEWMGTDEGSKASESDLMAMWELIEKIDDIKRRRNPLKYIIEAYEELAKARKEGDSDAEEKAWLKLKAATKLAADSIAAMASIITNVIDTSLELAEALGISFSDDTLEMIEAFKDGLKLIGPIMATVGAGMLFTANASLALQTALWPLLVITLALASAFAVIKWISGADVRAANKEIEKQEQRLTELDRAYKKLQNTQEELVGSDWVKNQILQIENLQKKVSAFQRQLDAEQSKGKKADEDAINDYKDSILDAQSEIKDSQRELISEMTGTSAVDTVKEFADAAVEAYLTFGNATDAMKESFRDMIKSMVANSLLARVIQRRLEPIFNAIDAAYKDGTASDFELANISEMMKSITETLPEELESMLDGFEWLKDWQTPETGDLTGIAKGVAQASEESVVTLSGYANSILYNQVILKNDVAAIRAILEGRMAAVSPATTSEGGFNVGQLVSLQQQSLSQLQAINLNTGRSADSLTRLEDKLDSIISAPGTTVRKVVNTRLSN